MTRRVTDALAVDRFREAGKSFCDLIDKRETLDLAEFLRSVQPSLATLVATVHALPEISRSPDLPEDPDSTKSYFQLQRSLAGHIGKYDVWTEIVDPYVDDVPINYMLSSALADVYRHVQPGLDEWATASADERRAYVWDWTFGFEILWGHSAIDAMPAIHALLFRHQIGDPDAEWPPTPELIAPR